jgi:two-component system response regulator AtoC
MTSEQDHVLIVDDEPILRESLSEWLRDEGYRVSTAEDAMIALRMIAEAEPDVAVVDIKMPGMDGVTLLKKIKETTPDLPVVMITAHGTIENAVRSMKEGAYDFITKPFPPEKLSVLLQRVLEHQKLKQENVRLQKERKQILHIAISVLVSFVVLFLVIYFVFSR